MNVIYGSANGLSADAVLPDQFWHQNIQGILDVAEQSEFFGAALATGVFNNDNYADPAVGIPGEWSAFPSGNFHTGAVNVIYGTAETGLSPTAVVADQLWNQNSPEMSDTSEFKEQFGLSLTDQSRFIETICDAYCP